MGDSVGFSVLGPWSVSVGEVESPKKRRPAGLTGVQMLGCLNVGEVLMISPHDERNLEPL